MLTYRVLDEWIEVSGALVMRYFQDQGQVYMRGVLSVGMAMAWAMLCATTCLAGPADVISAAAEPIRKGTYVVIATIRHDDESFDHFADRFEIIGPTGAILATRVLVHPHIDEQPFTRALTGVVIPDGILEIVVRAHDRRHGYGGKEVVVKLPGR